MGAGTANIRFSLCVIKSFYYGGFCLKKTPPLTPDEKRDLGVFFWGGVLFLFFRPLLRR